MSTLVTEKSIAEAIRTIAPVRIAVAFLGSDWRKYIPEPQKIEQIVISPTLGSNPKAILDLSEEIGWERIFLLDELHAKVYLGRESALLGSANLTANGLCGDALVELGTVVKSEEDLRTINTFIDDVVRRAHSIYRNDDSKIARVAVLQTLWNEAFSRRIIRPAVETNTIKNFVLATKEDFYVLWYMDAEYDYSAEVEQIESCIENEMHFHPDDKPTANRFVLTWRKASKGTADKRTKPSWMYIHEIFVNGVVAEDYEYTTVAIQRSDLAVPPVPFELSDEVVAKLFKAIGSDDLKEALVQDESSFRLARTFSAIEPLVMALR